MAHHIPTWNRRKEIINGGLNANYSAIASRVVEISKIAGPATGYYYWIVERLGGTDKETGKFRTTTRFKIELAAEIFGVSCRQIKRWNSLLVESGLLIIIQRNYNDRQTWSEYEPLPLEATNIISREGDKGVTIGGDKGVTTKRNHIEKSAAQFSPAPHQGAEHREANLASPSPREPSALDQGDGFDEDEEQNKQSDNKISIFLPTIKKMLSDIEGTKIDKSSPAQIYNDIINSAFDNPDVLYEYWSTQLLPNIKSESFMTKKVKSLGIGWCLQKALEIESGRYGGIDRSNISKDEVPAIPVGSTVTCSDSSRVSYIGRHGVIVAHFGADCMVRWGLDEDSETRMKYKDLKVFDDILVEENIM